MQRRRVSKLVVVLSVASYKTVRFRVGRIRVSLSTASANVSFAHHQEAFSRHSILAPDLKVKGPKPFLECAWPGRRCVRLVIFICCGVNRPHCCHLFVNSVAFSVPNDGGIRFDALLKIIGRRIEQLLKPLVAMTLNSALNERRARFPLPELGFVMDHLHPYDTAVK